MGHLFFDANDMMSQSRSERTHHSSSRDVNLTWEQSQLLYSFHPCHCPKRSYGKTPDKVRHQPSSRGSLNPIRHTGTICWRSGARRFLTAAPEPQQTGYPQSQKESPVSNGAFAWKTFAFIVGRMRCELEFRHAF